MRTLPSGADDKGLSAKAQYRRIHNCHPERSEGSGMGSKEILRCAQDDRRFTTVIDSPILSGPRGANDVPNPGGTQRRAASGAGLFLGVRASDARQFRHYWGLALRNAMLRGDSRLLRER